MKQELNQAFEKFNQFTILIIGDVMIDAYMWGKVDRISPEAPVPIISVTKLENRLGGAANVGLNIKALGAKPVLCSVIGNDEKGKLFTELLKSQEMFSSGIFISEQRKTTVKTRIISDNQHLLRIDEEQVNSLTEELETQFIRHIDVLFESTRFDAVIFEDYDKGTITPKVIKQVVTLAKKSGIPTLVDPKKRNFMSYHGVTLFKPNFKEICEGTKLEIPKGDFEALHQATQKLIHEFEIQQIMVTLSELGVFIANENNYYRIPAQIRDIADVSGAGDTVISVAACCLAAGMEPEKLAAISNIAGGLVCEKVGVVPVQKDQLLNEAISFYS